MPTAKEAGTIFGPLMAVMFIPFYGYSLSGVGVLGRRWKRSGFLS
ncbi:hypothetical protein ACFVGV_00435 [Pseudarthrobacter scleromae]